MTALDTAPPAAPGTPRAGTPATAADILADLDTGRRRAAWPDPTATDGWRIDEDVRAAILERFRGRTTREWAIEDVLRFRDRAGLPTKVLSDPSWRVVPGGSSIRAGVFLGPGVVVMPPSFVNVGAWVGAGTMIDSHVLVGSCAQIGARVHLAAGVIVGGVLEPAGARPVIVEDDAFVGAGAQLLEGVLVRSRAVIGAGVTLTGHSRLYDLVEERVHVGTPERPLVVPTGAVVVPGSRALPGAFAREHGLATAVALVVKRRDERTDARTGLEGALR